MKLFARGIKGEIREWSINHIDESNNAIIRSGVLGGNLIKTIIEHKDIKSEIASRIAKKRKEGYVSLKDLGYDIIVDSTDGSYLTSLLQKVLPKYNTDANNNLKPMKCQKFKERVITYPAIVQAKLNGVRCVLRWEEYEEGEGMFKQTVERPVLRGKLGLEYHMPHITKSFVKEDFYLDDRELAFDGELYKHGMPLNVIKSSCPMYNSKGTLSNPSGIPEEVEYHIFDLSIPDIVQEDRLDMIIQKFKDIEEVQHRELPFIKRIGRYYIYSDEDALSYRNMFLDLGYEGCVIRETGTEYAFGFRPAFIRKYKKFLDGEFLIIDIIPKPSDATLPLFVLRNDLNSETFECNPIGDQDIQREYLVNKQDYIGKYATVRYMERSGIKHVPFHANVIDIRKTKTSDL